MPDQASEDEYVDQPEEYTQGLTEDVPGTPPVQHEIEKEYGTPTKQDYPIPHLDSAIALMELEMCKSAQDSTPSKAPSTRRRKKSAPPRDLRDVHDTPSSLRINTHLPDVNDSGSPSSAIWCGSGSSHFIDRSYSPEPTDVEDDPFLTSPSEQTRSSSVTEQIPREEEPGDSEQEGTGQDTDPVSQSLPMLLVMSARVPDIPLPEEVLAGLGDWAYVQEHKRDLTPVPVQHPPDLHPSSVQPDVPQDRYNEDITNAIEEAYHSYCTFSIVRLQPQIGLSYYLRRWMAMMPLERRTLFLERLWNAGMRGQYYTMLASGPLLFSPSLIVGEGGPLSPPSCTQLPASGYSSPGSTTPVGSSSTVQNAGRSRKISFGGVTAVSSPPATRPCGVAFGEVTALPGHVPDASTHAAAAATSSDSGHSSSGSSTPVAGSPPVQYPAQPRKISWGEFTAVSDDGRDTRTHAATSSSRPISPRPTKISVREILNAEWEDDDDDEDYEDDNDYDDEDEDDEEGHEADNDNQLPSV